MNFFKRQKFKKKVTKIWTQKSNFELIFYIRTFSNVLNRSTKNCLKIQEFRHN